MRKNKKVRVRRLRHWKQRFKENAKFIWRTRTVYAGREYWPGDTIPKDLEGKPTKLRRFWESRRIELAEFDVPNVATGQVERTAPMPDLDLPDGVIVVRGKRSWFTVTTPDGEHKVNGQKALDALLDDLRAKANDDWLGEED